MRQQLSLLREVAFDLGPQRCLPRAADHEVEGHGGRHDDYQKCRQQLEENPVSQFVLTGELLASRVSFGWLSLEELALGSLEPVAGAAHRLQVAWIFRIRFDLFPDAPNIY